MSYLPQGRKSLLWRDWMNHILPWPIRVKFWNWCFDGHVPCELRDTK